MLGAGRTAAKCHKKSFRFRDEAAEKNPEPTGGLWLRA
jgi:hypothetical protein